MSAFACWMVARALLASAATSTRPVPSSSCARWISSYLWGQDGALQHFKGTGGNWGSGHRGKGLKHPQHGVPPRASPPAPDGQGAAVSCCQPSPGLQLTLCFPRRSPFQQALQELVAGFGHIQRSPDHRLHLCHRIPVPAGRRAPREVSSGEKRPPYTPPAGQAASSACQHHSARLAVPWCRMPPYLSASARASSARWLQLVGCGGISWGISFKRKEQQ